ncbi:MAG: hypothetical protein R2745_00790 [Vicinamibacterales bacterium]
MTGRRRVLAVSGVAGAMAVALTAGVLAADRALGWVRSGAGRFEQELNQQARRGLRLAAVSDGLPCSVAVLQAPASPSPAAEYRVVRDKDLAASLDGLVADGFVPRAATRVVGTMHEVAFERLAGATSPGRWRVVEFEKLETLADAVAAAGADGFAPRLLVRAPFRSWPGLSARGLILAEAAAGAGPVETRTLVATKRNVDDLSRDVAAATRAGWHFDLLYTQSRDGGPEGRRERAVVILSRGRGTAATGVEVTLDRRSSFGTVGKQIAGAAAFWDEYLFASAAVDRHQAWASPIQVDERDADCGPLGLTFRFSAPKDMAWPVIGLLAKPAVNRKDYELVVVTDQGIGVP